MSWITFIWSLTAGICLTLAGCEAVSDVREGEEMKRGIWELKIGNKSIEGDNPKTYEKLLNRLRKASKKAHNRRKPRIKG